MKTSKGKVREAEFLIVYGPPGIGKSSFASDAPSPFFLDAEGGSKNLDVERVEPETWEDVREAIELFSKSGKETLVVDTLDWLEKLLVQDVLKTAGKNTIQEIGGYGKGYEEITRKWVGFLDALDALHKDGKNIILLAHSEVKTMNDPTSLPYDRFQMKLYAKAAALFRERVSNLLFLNTETLTKQGEKRGFSDNVRYIFTERRPAYDAKNRFGLPERFELKQVGPFKHYLSLKNDSNPTDIATLRRQIEGLLEQVKDDDERKNIGEAYKRKTTVEELSSLKNKLEVYLG
jgi:hypothetical protein